MSSSYLTPWYEVPRSTWCMAPINVEMPNKIIGGQLITLSLDRLKYRLLPLRQITWSIIALKWVLFTYSLLSPCLPISKACKIEDWALLREKNEMFFKYYNMWRHTTTILLIEYWNAGQKTVYLYSYNVKIWFISVVKVKTVACNIPLPIFFGVASLSSSTE